MCIFRLMSSSGSALEPCSSTTLAFVDPDLQDYETLVAGLESGVQAIVLQDEGVEQITSTLLTNTCIESVHILASGSPGCVKLGKTLLHVATLDRYAQDLQIWFFLSQLCDRHPSLHLYGSRIAMGKQGRSFLKRLHLLTGAGIVASSSSIGHRSMGGNWELELQIGPVCNRTILKPELMARYQGLL